MTDRDSMSGPPLEHETCNLKPSLSGRSLHDPDLVGAVGLLEHDFDDLALGRRHALADVVGLDGDLPVPPVDQHRQADRPRPPEIDDPVERRADGAAGVENVVAEDESPAVDV